ncbi:hypothetical protein HPB50_008481 [Hyalomma asiaticum]|uniref:Uncharacterized protein n=1 Tax=Hyalomma asiaticum TaxID=266040 RepID=A0ACB7RSK0_HYAAI|nr:hypothetical protein HPB50_008481 [Hyalomma asiaticum]
MRASKGAVHFTVLCVLAVATTFVDRGYWQKTEETGLMERIRERALVAGADVPSDSSSRGDGVNSAKGGVTSAIPCDLFNRTEWSCWLMWPLNRTSRLQLRLSVADDALDRRRLRVAWRRKYKIRGQNLYAVEEINQNSSWLGSASLLTRDPLSLELNPVSDRDRFLNKIQAFVYVRRGRTDDVADSSGLEEVLYGQLTYVIDSPPKVVRPLDRSQEVVLALEDHLTLPPDGAMIEWKRRLSRVHFTAPPANVRLLAGGRLALVSLAGTSSVDQAGAATPLSLSCGVFARDGRFIGMRHFMVASSAERQGAYKANTQSSSPTTEGDTVIHLSVKLDSQPVAGAADSGDEYTVVQTNVSVSNGQVAPAAVDTGNQAPVAAQPQQRAHQPVPNQSSSSAGFTSNVCLRLIRGENGVPAVVPCESAASTAAIPKTATEGTRRREPHSRWRYHRPRGDGADDSFGRAYPRSRHRSRGADQSRKRPPVPSEDILRADIDGLQPCRADEECSRHASCIVPLGSTKGRCVCDRGYLGNGLFCWESFYV